MKILLISNMYPSKEKPYAGIFIKNQYEELRNLLNNGEEITIFYMKRRFTSAVGSLLKYFFAFIKFIPYLFRRYDVLHLHFFYPLIYFVWCYKFIHPNTIVVVTFHGKDITKLVTDANRDRLKRIAKIVDFTIPVGRTIAQMVNEKLELKTGMIQPVGVNNNVFYQEEGIAKEYDFIWIGSFIHRKGIDVVIKAIREMQDPGIRYCFCGSGEYLKQIEELQKSYKVSIRQNQTQDQLRVLLNSSRFFLLMSRNEGFPTATIEAMYCGIPVLTSDIPQFREQVLQGVNGFTTPVDDAEALQERLLQLYTMEEGEYHKLCQGALKSFKELSLRQVCEELLETYRKLTML